MRWAPALAPTVALPLTFCPRVIARCSIAGCALMLGCNCDQGLSLRRKLVDEVPQGKRVALRTRLPGPRTRLNHAPGGARLCLHPYMTVYFRQAPMPGVALRTLTSPPKMRAVVTGWDGERSPCDSLPTGSRCSQWIGHLPVARGSGRHLESTGVDGRRPCRQRPKGSRRNCLRRPRSGYPRRRLSRPSRRTGGASGRAANSPGKRNSPAGALGDRDSRRATITRVVPT